MNKQIEKCFKAIKDDEPLLRQHEETMGYSMGISLDTIQRLTDLRERIVNLYDGTKNPDDRIVKAAIHLIFECDGGDRDLHNRCFTILGQTWNEQRARVLKDFPHGPTLHQYAQAIGIWRRGNHNWIWQRGGLHARMVRAYMGIESGEGVSKSISSNIKPDEYPEALSIARQAVSTWSRMIRQMERKNPPILTLKKPPGIHPRK